MRPHVLICSWTSGRCSGKVDKWGTDCAKWIKRRADLCTATNYQRKCTLQRCEVGITLVTQTPTPTPSPSLEPTSAPTSTPSTWPTALTLEGAIHAAVEPILEKFSAKYGHSGWSFAFRNEDTKVHMCAGWTDTDKKRKCKTSDLYGWGSTTKSFTAVSVLRIIEDGELGLNDSVVKCADRFLRQISGHQMSLEATFGPKIHKVTLLHLLQMSSGIPDYDTEHTRLYQAHHPDKDLGPLWILNNSFPKPPTFECDPGECGRYSSTNYVLLGLVLGQHQRASDWDSMSQLRFLPRSSSLHSRLYFPTHGKCSSFRTADGTAGSTVHGLQPLRQRPFGPRPLIHDPGLQYACVPDKGAQSDARKMSCTQGWTCGNLVARAEDVAEFWWQLFGSRSILQEGTLRKMTEFWRQAFFKDFPPECYHDCPKFGYGYGVMDLSDALDLDESVYGHNGLAWGFGAMSGYSVQHKFSIAWVNNREIGGDFQQISVPIYNAVLGVLCKHGKIQTRDSTEACTALRKNNDLVRIGLKHSPVRSSDLRRLGLK